MSQRKIVNIAIIAVVIVLIGVGTYFVLSRRALVTPALMPTPTLEALKSGRVTVIGETTCLPKKDAGQQTMECAIGLKAVDDRYYGLENLFELDPEYKFSAGGLRVEVSGVFDPKGMRGPDGNEYDVVGAIDVISIKER